MLKSMVVFLWNINSQFFQMKYIYYLYHISAEAVNHQVSYNIRNSGISEFFSRNKRDTKETIWRMWTMRRIYIYLEDFNINFLKPLWIQNNIL